MNLALETPRAVRKASRSGIVVTHLLLVLTFCHAPASAQLSMRTLSSARYGELPRAFDGTMPAYYTDVITEYQYQWLRVGARAEAFASPEASLERDKAYQHFRQRYAEAFWSWGSARVGNFYGIFGKAIILRGFELPGFIYESIEARQQQRVVRDFDGYKLFLSPGPLAVTILGGTPIQPLDSPENKDRRSGKLGGAEVKLALPGGVAVGGAYLEHRTNSTPTSALATRFLAWSADELLQKAGVKSTTADLYVEYATLQGAGAFAKLNTSAPRALYLAGNFTWKALGASMEYKDYRRFDFGINDPPPLVRENAEYLLNRATHVLHHYSAEKGYQLELYYSLLASMRFVGNYSLARYEDFSGSSFLFQERYLGFELSGEPWTARLFVDSGQDGEISELERLTGGIALDHHFNTGPNIGMDLQGQRIRRAAPPFFDYTFRSYYAALRLQDWHKLSITLRSERSKDPDYTTSVKYFTSATIGWQPVPRIDLQLFAGKRRDGTACDHGYCIQVLGFEGTELRMEMRW